MTFPSSPDSVAIQVPSNQEGARTATLIAACATMGGIAMTITVASIALAGVQGELRLGITQLQWVLNSFIVSYALLLLPFGAWSDRRGQRPLFLWGAVVFVVGAAGAVLARDVTVLIAGRAVQGVGAALLTATAPAALTLAFQNEADRKRVFGYMGSSGGIGLALGALLAGALYGLVDYLGLTSVPAEQAGLAAGAFNVVRLLGDIFAAIIPGAVVFQIVSASLVGVPHEMLGEIAAGDLRVVDHLGLTAEARAAFIDGMQWALWTLLALTAVGVLVSLQIRDAKSSRD